MAAFLWGETGSVTPGHFSDSFHLECQQNKQANEQRTYGPKVASDAWSAGARPIQAAVPTIRRAQLSGQQNGPQRAGQDKGLRDGVTVKEVIHYLSIRQ